MDNVQNAGSERRGRPGNIRLPYSAFRCLGKAGRAACRRDESGFSTANRISGDEA